jgi:RNA polymerase sigma-70 factor (ECF subfamily)
MPAETPTDETLFERYRGGDKASIRVLIERYHDDLLRFLTRLVGDRTGAEDVFQDTFLQIHQASHTFDAERRFRPWLFTIAANKGRDYLRRKGRRRMLDLSAPVGNDSDSGPQYVDLMEVRIPTPGEAMESEETSRLVQAALDELSLPLREILLLAYFQRLSYAQIAEELEIPLGTVKSRLHAAVAAFAKKWDAMLKVEEERREHKQRRAGGQE